MTKPPGLLPDEILSQVKGSLWKKVLFFPAIDSTNEAAARLASAGEADEGTVILADRQEKGRGRLGRTWISPPGLNIYMSIILKPAVVPRQVTLLTLLASVASCRAIRKQGPLPVSIKWPNDLVISGKKIGGILTEVRTGSNVINLAVVGIGINVNSNKSDFPPELETEATSLRMETGEEFSRNELLVSILKELESWYGRVPGEGRDLIAEWKGLSSTLGRRVRITMGKEALTGMAEDIDDEGLLMLRLPSGRLRPVSSGDVTMVR